MTYLDSLISTEQSTFISNKSLHDNIFVAQEVIHSMYNSKSMSSLVMAKLYFKKAYSWPP